MTLSRGPKTSKGRVDKDGMVLDDDDVAAPVHAGDQRRPVLDGGVVVPDADALLADGHSDDRPGTTSGPARLRGGAWGSSARGRSTWASTDRGRTDEPPRPLSGAGARDPTTTATATARAAGVDGAGAGGGAYGSTARAKA